MLLVTLKAKAHRVIDFALGDGLRRHVAVAHLAIDSRANVRRVIEFHVRRRLEAVDALPGNVLAAIEIRGDLLDLGLVRGDHPMAGHAEIDARDAGVGPLVDAHVAVDALQPIGEMHFVRESDRLNGRRSNAKVLANRVEDRGMSRGEDFVAW